MKNAEIKAAVDEAPELFRPTHGLKPKIQAAIKAGQQSS